MSKKFRKVLAAILAGTMVLGSGVVANASSGNAIGEGDVVQVENPDIFNVILPVDNGVQFDYILDPTGVIEKTDFEEFGGRASASFVGTGNMWFENKKATDSDPRKFTNESDPATAYNKSNVDVIISVEAKLATPSGIVIATSSSAVNNVASPSMYLAVKATESTGPKEYAVTAAGVTATSSIASASTAYETRHVNGKYVNQLTASASELDQDDATFGTYFKSYSFVLTGACNAAGDWKSIIGKRPPVVNLVWTIDKPNGAVEAESGPKVTVSTSGAISITGLTAEQNYVGADLTIGSNTYEINTNPVDWDTSNWSTTDGGSITGQLGNEWTEWLIQKGGNITITVNLSDDTTKTATTTLS